MRALSKFFLIFALSCQFLVSNYAFASDCFKYFKAESISEDSRNFRAGKLAAIHYPVGLQISRLGINPKELSGKKIALLGDGFSGLGLSLLKAGADVQIYDPIYSNGIDLSSLNDLTKERINEYRSLLQDRMHANSAAKTDLPANSVDLVLAHLLINNLSIEKTINIFLETLRVLQHQGRAHFVTQVVVPVRDENPNSWINKEPSVPYLIRLEQHGTVKDLNINVSPPEPIYRSGIELKKVVIEINFTKP